MDDIPIIGLDDDAQVFKRVLASYSAPAYIRRARQVEDAFDQLINTCDRHRQDWLKDVRSRLGLLCPNGDDWDTMLPYVANGNQLLTLGCLCATLAVTSAQRENSHTARSYRRRLRELRMSIDRFNKRWLNYVHTLDLTRINELRDGYNRYYLLEKECAMRSARLARQHFRRLEPMTREAVLDRFPLLPVPAFDGDAKRQRLQY
jgi:hypothetical protein